MKVYLAVVIALLSLSCTAQEPKDDRSQEITPYLTSAIKGTPYSALIEKISVQFVNEYPDGSWEYLIRANVLETYRGAERAEIVYRMIVPKNESVNIENEPIIITLCESEKGLYWPGVGAQFPANDQLTNTAIKMKSQLHHQTSFSGC